MGCYKLMHGQTENSGVKFVVSKPWSGRFRANTDQRVEAFTQSISFDHRLFKQDIQGSIAHANMLASVGLLTSTECQQIVRTLSEIQAEIENGQFRFAQELEDVHMHIEAALVEKLEMLGEVAYRTKSQRPSRH